MSIKIDFDKITGKIKPMNGVNNGPAAMSVRGRFIGKKIGNNLVFLKNGGF